MAQTTTVAIMVVLVLLAVLAGLLWWWSRTGPPGMRQPAGTAEESGMESQPVAAEGARKAGPKRARAPAKVAELVFPTPETVPAGMEKTKLLEKCGRPNMITTSVELGQVMETLVYIQPGLVKTETVIVLKNGSVASVTSNTR